MSGGRRFLMWRQLRAAVRAGDEAAARKLAKQLGYRDRKMVTRLIEKVWASTQRRAAHRG